MNAQVFVRKEDRNAAGSPWTGRPGPARVSGFFAAVLMLAASAAAQPQLVVRVNGVEIVNHEELAFPDTVVGATSEIVVTLRNEGVQTLQFTEDPPVQLAGGFPGSFGLVQPMLEAGGTLTPNGSTAFVVRFQPAIQYPRLFTHIYLWTSADVSPFHIVISGRAVLPQMVVSSAEGDVPDGGQVTFEETEVGQVREVVLTIENLGDGNLELIGNPRAALSGPDAGLFTITQSPAAQVAPNGTTEVHLAFQPTEAGEFSARLLIDTNEQSATLDSLYDIDLLASAVNPPPAEEEPAEPAEPSDPTEPAEPVEPIEPAEPAEPFEPAEQVEQDAPEDAGGGDSPVDGEGLQGMEDAVAPVPVGMCGFGAGFASLMSLVSVGGLRLGRSGRGAASRRRGTA